MSYKDISACMNRILLDNEGGIGSLLLKKEIEDELHVYFELPKWDQWLRGLAQRHKIRFHDLGAGGVVFHLEDRFYNPNIYSRSEFQREIGYKTPGAGDDEDDGSK